MPGRLAGAGAIPGGAISPGGGFDRDEPLDPFDDASEMRRLRRSVFAELVIAAVILAVTAVLVNAPPARSVSTAPVNLTLESPGLWVDVGGNDIHVYSLPVGGGVANISGMQMQLTKVGADLPPLTVPLRDYGGGHYYAPLFDIPYPGEWQMTIRAQTGPTEEAVLTGKFTLR
jgi:copper transport protein